MANRNTKLSYTNYLKICRAEINFVDYNNKCDFNLKMNVTFRDSKSK